MTLIKLGQNFNLLNNFSRFKQAGFNAACGKIQRDPSRVETFHMTSVRRYPEAPTLPLPTNVSEIFSSETGRFSPERSRDISTPILLYENTSKACEKSDQQISPSKFFDNVGQVVSTDCADNHIDSYDCFGAVSLNGIMQTNVPKPYCARGKSTPLNMPGGQWVRDGKYIAEDMQNSHYRNQGRCVESARKIGTSDGVSSKQLLTSVSFHAMYRPRYVNQMDYSTDAKTASPTTASDATKQTVEDIPQVSKKDRLKIMVKDYGKTVIVFHVTISLISLGACYTAVVSGVDLQWIVNQMIGPDQERINTVLNTSTNFIVAYTIHKMLAPIRLSITLGLTPLIVKKLRKKGILRHPELKEVEEYVKKHRS